MQVESAPQRNGLTSRTWCWALIFVAFVLCTGLVVAQESDSNEAESKEVELLSDRESAELRATIELLRADIRAEKTEIIADNIAFTADEAAAFWPLHAEYTLALNQLMDDRLYLINEYLNIHETMTDREAKSFVKRAFKWEKRRLRLERKWFNKFSRAIPPRRAAQFIQLENRLNATIDMQISAALPLIR